ncbi:unnamed protein product, partial [Prorocentrum cordatum]
SHFGSRPCLGVARLSSPVGLGPRARRGRSSHGYGPEPGVRARGHPALEARGGGRCAQTEGPDPGAQPTPCPRRRLCRVYTLHASGPTGARICDRSFELADHLESGTGPGLASRHAEPPRAEQCFLVTVSQGAREHTLATEAGERVLIARLDRATSGAAPEPSASSPRTGTRVLSARRPTSGSRATPPRRPGRCSWPGASAANPGEGGSRAPASSRAYATTLSASARARPSAWTWSCPGTRRAAPGAAAGCAGRARQGRSPSSPPAGRGGMRDPEAGLPGALRRFVREELPAGGPGQQQALAGQAALRGARARDEQGRQEDVRPLSLRAAWDCPGVCSCPKHAALGLRSPPSPLDPASPWVRT